MPYTASSSLVAHPDIATVDEPGVASAVAPRLQDVPGFMAQDISCNRDGKLSLQQRRGLYLDCLKSAAVVLMSLGFCLGWLLSHGLGLIPLICGAGAVWEFRRVVIQVLDIREAAVVDAVGIAVPQLVTNSDDPDEFYLHIDSERLVLTKQQYGALTPDGPYRVFPPQSPEGGWG